MRLGFKKRKTIVEYLFKKGNTNNFAKRGLTGQ